jgi:hypothetical protein
MLNHHIDAVEEMLTDLGGTVGQDYSGRQVIEAARKHAAFLESGEKTVTVPINQHIRRVEDMGQGRLELFREEDGDMIVTVINDEGESSTIQFTTYGLGGGQSPKVLKALYDLARAMLDENETAPQHGRLPLAMPR